jgi:hypothetical protein
LLYSKEDPQKADKALSKYLVEMTDLDAKDRAKLLLIELEIRLQLGYSIDDSGIKSLIRDNDKDDDWEKIEQRYTEILHGK